MGWEKVIQETGMLNLIGNENNEVSSILVHPNCTLKLFNEHNNVKFLGSWVHGSSQLSYHDQASSLLCACQGMITTPTHLEPI